MERCFGVLSISKKSKDGIVGLFLGSASVQVHSYLKEQHSLKEQLTTVVP